MLEIIWSGLSSGFVWGFIFYFITNCHGKITASVGHLRWGQIIEEDELKRNLPLCHTPSLKYAPSTVAILKSLKVQSHVFLNFI